MKKLVFLFLMTAGFFVSEANAQTSKTPESGTPFSIADSASYTGKYKYEGLPFEYMTISVRENRLYFEGGEYNGFLDPIKDKKDVFDAGGGLAVFTFLRNEQSKVAELKIDYQGQTFFGKREEKKS